jgi:integrase
MTRDKKSIREPAVSEQDVRPRPSREYEDIISLCDRLGVHPEYREFLQYKKNRNVKDSTLVSWTWKLNGFPEPDKLREQHFENRLSQKISKKTVRFELTLARMFLKWAKRKEQLEELQEFDIGKSENGITEEDIYSMEELNAIFQSAECTRDRAMLQVLYESGFRASELLSMTYEGIRQGKEGRLEVKCHESKTKERWVILDMSVPALQEWRESHPFKSGALWVTRRKRAHGDKQIGDYEPISYVGFYHMVNKALRDAGIRKDKKRIIHLFRHTRITHLRIGGTQGIPLHSYVGWTPGSNMERVYVHMNQQEVLDQFYKTQLDITEDAPVKKIFEKRICDRCGTENEPTRGYCKSCNRALTPELQAIEEKTELEKQVANLQGNMIQMGYALRDIVNTFIDMPEDERREKFDQMFLAFLEQDKKPKKSKKKS